ncbi:type I-E CRISPR-associated protein Cas7/Cse4/CasC [Acanthopleuribacter pedis]|uniref:Type I-E CRISPR-associated protein Cas7/Cse4/CasC n=1 Tax=Acanthopleuribacter pedis TaxID=442870 RepID=A0A8J7QJ10_9BACT|nr:type I-E CRISPR-associated protein Cas7/Cse4/CasC [Acanthopleuribacter pedis]MBO1323265.1 type I-E CRISPR-associated protein Cas7/Cse4/CasC [Acanthopleuribacter pedis]
MFLEVSAIQHFSSVNLNRDDANAIKTIHFGGYERQRVSSQCFKRAMRQHRAMEEARAGNESYRTKYVFGRMAELLELKDKDSKKHKALAEYLTALGLGKFEVPKKGKKKKVDEAAGESVADGQVLKTLFFTSDRELAQAAACLRENEFDVKAAAKAFQECYATLPIALDIALFGRMAASDVTLNVDAAVQVAHAVSTNEIVIEDDFFTAVDDLGSEERQGANMIGTTQVASPCFYRYACLSLDILKRNLGEAWETDRDRAVAGFVASFILASPTGKANSTAPHSVPDFVLVSVGENQPISLVNAFDQPVYADQHRGLAAGSVDALMTYLGKINRFYDWGSGRTAFLGGTVDIERPQAEEIGIKKVPALKALLEDAVTACREVGV